MIHELLSRLGFLMRRRPNDLDEELRAHMEHSIESKIASGMSPEEARRQAGIEFGSMQAAREQSAEQHPRMGFGILGQDLRFGLRSLKRDRGFAIVAILILALGIGGNIAVFSLVNTILLRPLPFKDPQQVVWLEPAEKAGGLSGSTYSSDAYDDLIAMNRSYSGVTGYFAFSAPNNMKLTGNGIPSTITGIGVLPNFLDVLGIKPELGRNFLPNEGAMNAPAVALLSHAFWKTHFNGDPNIVGKAISVDDKPLTIVGVLPQAFDFGATFSPGTRVDVLSPFSLEMGRDWGNIITFIGRLKPGVTPQQASTEAATLFPRFYNNKKYSNGNGLSRGDYGPGVATPIKEHVAGQLRRSLYVLWAAVGMILLIVCVNLSNLLLGRAATRSKEFSVRFALGASRSRLIRQLLTESALLSFFGTLLGIGLAEVIVQWLAHQGSVALPLLSELRIDTTSLLWTVLLAFATTLLFGVMPSLRITGGDLQSQLKDSGPGTSEGRSHERLRNTLVISEIALACVLIVSAGLLLRSFLRVMDVDLGYQPTQAASISVDLPMSRGEARYAFYRNLLHEVSTIPGVQSVGISDNLPLARNRTWGPPRIKGVDYQRGQLQPTFVYVVTPGYLTTMGMHLRGRDISWNDNTNSENVIILNEKAAHFLFPHGDAIDHKVMQSGKEVRVIGVVSNIHETDVEASSAWQIYLPITQGWGENGAELVVRSTLPASTLGPTVLQTLRKLNPGQPAMQLRPLQEFVDHSTSPRRFFAVLVAAFAGTGLLLACLGIYGVISYSVTRKTQEIGIRMALGASRDVVLRNIIGRTLQLTAVGIVVGAIASFVVAQSISAMLYGTQPTDPATFSATLVLLLVVALLAGYLPARRASRIDPMAALRTQ
jgi:predicted permease